jgi:hypothetical protein
LAASKRYTYDWVRDPMQRVALVSTTAQRHLREHQPRIGWSS